LEFQVGDIVFLKVSPTEGIKRFGVQGKLSPRYIRLYEIINKLNLMACYKCYSSTLNPVYLFIYLLTFAHLFTLYLFISINTFI